MPTNIIRSIGPGGYYTTLQAWANDCPADLVAADQVWIGEVLNTELFQSGGTMLTISGVTTDATRHQWLRAAPGASWREHANVRTNALRYNAANGAAIRCDTFYTQIFNISSGFFRLSNLQLASGSGEAYDYGITGVGTIIENCIIGGDGRNKIIVSGNNANPPIIRNNIFIRVSTIDNGTSLTVGNLYNKAIIVNNLFIRPSNHGVSGTAVDLGWAEQCYLANNAVLGFSNFLTGVYSQPTIRTNVLTNASLGVGGTDTTGNIFNVTYADQIEQPSAAVGLDARTKSGAALIDAGTDTSTHGVTADATGIARSGTYDVGAWEFINPNATAAGVTITASSSIVAGSTTLDQTANGQTVVASSSAITGTSTVGSTAAGAVVTTATSSTDGSATLDQTAAGATVTATTAVASGSPNISETVSGGTVAATASSTSGTASSEQTITADGVTVTATTAVVSGSQTLDQTATGTTVSTTATPIGGSQIVDQTAPGATVSGTASAIAGSSTSEQTITAAGATEVATASSTSGSQIVDQTAPGATVSGTASATSGSVGVSPPAVSGATVTVLSTAIAGSTAIQSAASGATGTATAQVVSGTQAITPADVLGAVIVATTSAIAGSSTSEQTIAAAGSTVVASTSAVAGTIQLDQTVSGATAAVVASAVSGTQRLDQSVVGVTATATATLTAGSTVASQQATGSGNISTATTEAISGSQALDQTAAGAAVVATGSAISGQINLSPAPVAGATVAATTSANAGNVSVSATVAGVTVSATVSSSSGAQQLDQTVAGQTVSRSAVAVAGSTSAHQTAPSTTLFAFASGIVGLTQVDSVVAGATVTTTAVSVAGNSSLSQTASGVIAAAAAAPISGATRTDSIVAGATATASAAAVPGGIAKAETVAGASSISSAVALSGSATVSVIVSGSIITATTALVAGDGEASSAFAAYPNPALLQIVGQPASYRNALRLIPGPASLTSQGQKASWSAARIMWAGDGDQPRLFTIPSSRENRDMTDRFIRHDAGIFQASLSAMAKAISEFCPRRDDGTQPQVVIARDQNHFQRVQGSEGQIVMPAVSVSLEGMRRKPGGYNRIALKQRIAGELSDDGRSVARFALSQVEADLRCNFSSDNYEEIVTFGAHWIASDPRCVVRLESMGVGFTVVGELSPEVQIPPPSDPSQPAVTTLTAGLIMTSYVGFFYMEPTLNSIAINIGGAGRDPSGKAWALTWDTVDKKFEALT